MKGSYLGEFEELVLLTVGSLYKEAYGVAIMDEIESQCLMTRWHYAHNFTIEYPTSLTTSATNATTTSLG